MDYPIDDLSPVQQTTEKQNDNQVVKVVAIALFLITLVFSLLCFENVVGIINRYFSFRHKFVAFFTIHSPIVAISLGVLPVIAYYHWRRKYRNTGFIPYLVLLCVVVMVFLVSYISGMELLFALPKNNVNPLLPSYIIYPPSGFYFDLLFILSVVFPFGILQLIIRNRTKREKNY